MKTVCIIIPPSPFLLDERVFPFLGPLKVAASLRSRGWSVEVLDLTGIKNYLDVVTEHASISRATHFGITATTPQFPQAVQIARSIRSVMRWGMKSYGPKVILGGTHATLTVAGVRYEKSQNRIGRAHKAYGQIEEHFDVIVAGDGEETIFHACQDDAPKLIDADNRDSPFFLTDETLGLTPFPARDLIDMASYHYRIEGESATTLIAQLGCPYKCGFCAGRSSPMLRNIRMRSDDSVIEEMKFLYQTYGYKAFMFYDDELNVNKGMIELMQKIAKTQRDFGVQWKLRGFVKSERFNHAQAEALYEAGFRQLLVGFESGSPRILQNIQKIATQDDNTRCMDIARLHGLKVKALMSMGHPGESEKTIEETRRWLLDVCPSDFDATVITPYPGSPYYNEALPDGDVWTYTCKNGDKLHQVEVNYTLEADYYKGDPEDGYISHVWTPDVSPEDLVRLRNDTEFSVRKELGIPFNPKQEAQSYEHSMGQTVLPDWILRKT